MNIDWKSIRFDGKERFSAAESVSSISDLYESKKDYRRKIKKLRKKIDEKQRVMYTAPSEHRCSENVSRDTRTESENSASDCFDWWPGAESNWQPRCADTVSAVLGWGEAMRR